MKSIRYKYSDIEIGKEFEIIVNKYRDLKIIYVKGREYIVFNTSIDIGVDKPDYRDCSLSLPYRMWMRALLEWKQALREDLIMNDKKIRVRIKKESLNSMKITVFEEFK